VVGCNFIFISILTNLSPLKVWGCRNMSLGAPRLTQGIYCNEMGTSTVSIIHFLQASKCPLKKKCWYMISTINEVQDARIT
jgi:hypothetical protein